MTGIIISNKEIYDRLCKLEVSNAKQHEQIILKIIGYKSQIANLKYAIGGIGVLAFATLGWFIISIQ
jgi:hypothetical protein